jgi:hypothetical protein
MSDAHTYARCASWPCQQTSTTPTFVQIDNMLLLPIFIRVSFYIKILRWSKVQIQAYLAQNPALYIRPDSGDVVLLERRQ